MKRRTRFNRQRPLQLVLLLFVLVVALGCRARQSLDEPPEVQFGVDVCDQCGMIISESRFAATYVTTGGDVRKFESIGDMVKYHLEHQESVHRFWVHDYYADAWLRGDEATFVISERIVTPMGDSVLATADQDSAGRLVADGGGLTIDFEQMITLAQSGDLFSGSHAGHSD